MKKLFMFLAVAGLTTFGTSCSSDDGGGGNGGGDPVTGLKLSLTTDASEVYAGEVFELSIQTADGANVDGAELYISGAPNANPILSVDGVFSIQGPEGSYEFSAVYDGEESNVVNVNVQPSRAVSEGEGTFDFGGDTYDIESSFIVFRGLAWEDETQSNVVASWQIEAYSGNHVAIVMFSTPTTPAGGDQYNYEVPNATNTTGVATGVIEGQTLLGTSEEDVEVDFNATLAGNMFEGAYSATSGDINGDPFSLTFDGKTPRVNSTGKLSAKGSVNYVVEAVVGTKVKAENLTVINTKELTRM